MSDAPHSSPDSPNTPPLQFDTAEHATSSASTGRATCAACSVELTHEYHELNGQAVCAVCRAKAEVEHAHSGRWSQFIVASAYGVGAMLLGALLYFGFVKLTDFEIGIMAIAVGWMVGKAVMKGSNMRGGRRYQWLAITLTYLSITLSYGILIVDAMRKGAGEEAKGDKAAVLQAGKQSAQESQEPKAGSPAEAKSKEDPGPFDPNMNPLLLGLLSIGMLFGIMLATPFLGGFNPIGWLIIAIGLWEAWKHTAAVPFITGGPYRFGPPPTPSSAPVSDEPTAAV